MSEHESEGCTQLRQSTLETTLHHGNDSTIRSLPLCPSSLYLMSPCNHRCVCFDAADGVGECIALRRHAGEGDGRVEALERQRFSISFESAR